MQSKFCCNRQCLFILLGIILSFVASLADAEETHYHEFVVQRKVVNRLCNRRKIITVNGQFPGPTIVARNGDKLVIKVTNRASSNISLHWHGIRQMRTPWADGPAYITQCPIMPGATYTYRFTIENQEGEWWDRDINAVMRRALFSGAAPNVSDAYTINGQPGDLYRCSRQGTMKIRVNSGDKVLLRVINAALNQQLFFSVANHKLTVVEADATYHKPFTTRVIMLGPGQTTNVLLTADQPPARYYMAARAYATGRNNPFDNTTTTAILEYKTARSRSSSRPVLPQLPAFNDTATVTAFTSQLKSIPSNAKVPTNIDESLFFTVGLGLVNCAPGPRCQGPNNSRLAASMNNVSGVLPNTTSILQAYYQNIPGVFTTDFPPSPPVKFDYTGTVSRALSQPTFGTKLYKVKFGSNVQIVLQDTAIVTTEDHPIHLHGYHFFVVGQGFGNFNPKMDTSKFNLIDPPVRNTIDVPTGGWAVIRFVADNPGVWLFHCHIDSHLTWGLAMSFLVENGIGKSQTIEPPPADLPQC
ncbi:hypothetical protein BUALT_Bualt13G0097400 [Buddleja alternifolia]|uniref:Laccase n=1 Tax=Buddleja alternifolia TaxID=168488 RepID=A0AAV6WN74_9LAMI|nr:hypothetical protein BUALT_Bualt13G0097400 [Buddleja alternifolia]